MYQEDLYKEESYSRDTFFILERFICMTLKQEIDGPQARHWAAFVAQTVKNLPAMQETWVLSLGLEDLLEKGMATHSSILD